MKFNIAFPRNGTQKSIEIIDQKQWAKLIDMRLGQEFDGAIIGAQFAGYVFKITGGSDSDGFGMKQGVMTKNKIKLLLKEGSTGFFPKREGTPKRKTVRGCIIGLETASINLVIIQKGEQEIAGVTDANAPRRLGPKRANKIRKLFSLPRHSDNLRTKNDKVNVETLDVCRYVVKRQTKVVGDKKYYKAPKIQRLITSERLRRKRVRVAEKYNSVKINQQKIENYKKSLLKSKPVVSKTPVAVVENKTVGAKKTK